MNILFFKVFLGIYKISIYSYQMIDIEKELKVEKLNN
jgi:hypothetical protein